MTTDELQRIDELVHCADMAVRVASQLHLWLKRNTLGDEKALRQSLRFLDEAISGGKFVTTGATPWDRGGKVDSALCVSENIVAEAHRAVTRIQIITNALPCGV
jgi:hypothetical protein